MSWWFVVISRHICPADRLYCTVARDTADTRTVRLGGRLPRLHRLYYTVSLIRITWAASAVVCPVCTVCTTQLAWYASRDKVSRTRITGYTVSRTRITGFKRVIIIDCLAHIVCWTITHFRFAWESIGLKMKLFIVYVKMNYSQDDWKLIHTTVKRTIRMSVRSVSIHDGATWSRENWVNDVYSHDGAILAASRPCSTDAISLDDLFLALYNSLNAI